jgi:hypothetical protein
METLPQAERGPPTRAVGESRVFRGRLGTGWTRKEGRPSFEVMGGEVADRALQNICSYKEWRLSRSGSQGNMTPIPAFTLGKGEGVGGVAQDRLREESVIPG